MRNIYYVFYLQIVCLDFFFQRMVTKSLFNNKIQIYISFQKLYNCVFIEGPL
jgi:hypothetical protein